jgi:hypothetical protein
MRSYSIAERIAFVITFIAVVVLALLPAARLQEFDIDIGFHSDKLNHAAAFAVLTFLGSLGWPDSKSRLVVFLAVVGAAIEVLQGLSLIARDVDVLDWIADCVGIAFGLFLVFCLSRWVRRPT